MNTLARTSLMQVAALAAVCVVVSSIAGQSAAAKNEARHPDIVAQAFEVLEQSGQYVPVRHEAGPGKGDLEIVQDACTEQAWPYISAACVTGMRPGRQVARMITIEKRTGETSSALIRVRADQQIAAR